MELTFKYLSKIGSIYITADEHNLISVKFSKKTKNCANYKNFIIEKTIQQLNEYFNSERKYFDLPIKYSGTEFQEKVRQELNKVPYGETRTYKEIAAAIKNPNAMRAIGSACSKNPFVIIIPCHRIIGSNKNLTGYSGGPDKKLKLLQLENAALFKV